MDVLSAWIKPLTVLVAVAVAVAVDAVALEVATVVEEAVATVVVSPQDRTDNSSG